MILLCHSNALYIVIYSRKSAQSLQYQRKIVRMDSLLLLPTSVATVVDAADSKDSSSSSSSNQLVNDLHIKQALLLNRIECM